MLGAMTAPPCPLQEAGRDQEAGVGGEGAQRRREHEAAQAEAEAPPAAVVVAEATTADEKGRAGQGVPGDQPLDGRRARVQAALDVGQGHVDDEEVEDEDEGPGQDDGERGPGGDARDRTGVRVPLLAGSGHTRSLGSPMTGGSRHDQQQAGDQAETRSQTKIRVSPGLMAPPAPRLP